MDKKELIKLSPEDRIKRLKEMEKALEEEKKKQLEELTSLIKQSMQELRTGKLASEIAPQQRKVEISNLFERTGENGLEMTARQARQERPAKPMKASYVSAVQVYEDYSHLKKMYGTLSAGNQLTEEQLAVIGTIGERLNIAEKYISDSVKLSNVLDTSRTILYKLRKETGLGYSNLGSGSL
jgi:hypothetical protein